MLDAEGSVLQPASSLARTFARPTSMQDNARQDKPWLYNQPVCSPFALAGMSRYYQVRTVASSCGSRKNGAAQVCPVGVPGLRELQATATKLLRTSTERRAYKRIQSVRPTPATSDPKARRPGQREGSGQISKRLSSRLRPPTARLGRVRGRWSALYPPLD